MVYAGPALAQFEMDQVIIQYFDDKVVPAGLIFRAVHIGQDERRQE